MAQERTLIFDKPAGPEGAEMLKPHIGFHQINFHCLVGRRRKRRRRRRRRKKRKVRRRKKGRKRRWSRRRRGRRKKERMRIEGREHENVISILLTLLGHENGKLSYGNKDLPPPPNFPQNATSNVATI